MSTLLQLQNGSKSFGAKLLFDQASFAINEGEHLGVIGPNGAGKTTMFKCLVGEADLDSGEVTKKQNCKIAYLKQEDDWLEGETCIQYLMRTSSTEEWKLRSLGPQFEIAEDYFDRPMAELSGGFKTRLRLLGLTSSHPDLLLLDEPTNYLDLQTIYILEKFLIDFKGAFLLISHDREFLKHVTESTLEIESGQMTKYPGHVEDYLEQKILWAELKEKQIASQQKQRQHLLSFVERFRAKATKAKQAQSRLKTLNKMETIEATKLTQYPKIPIPEANHSQKMTVSIKEGEAGYEDIKILSDVNVQLKRGDHLVIVGKNGQGKSTLLKTLANKIPCLKGEWQMTSEFSFFHQHSKEGLDPQETVLGELQKSAEPDVGPQQILDLAGGLMFRDQDLSKKIQVLSGGEKTRVALAKILLRRSPILLLDEPTNHLDFQTVESLAQAMAEFKGTLICVSHDRSFTEQVATQILEVSNGQATLYPGTYDEYVWSVQKGIMGIDTKQETESDSQDESVKNQPTSSNKINFKERMKELNKLKRELSKEIERAEREQEKFQTQVSTLNQQLIDSPDNSLKLVTELGEVQELLDKAESKWMTAQEKMEQVDSEIQELQK